MLWAHAMGVLLATLGFRLLPFAAHALLSRAVAWEAKASWVLAFAAITLAADALGAPVDGVLVHAPLSLLYFAAVSIGLYYLRRQVTGAHPVPLFALAAGAYTVAPAVVLRTPSVVPAIVVGWEAMLSAYSYWMDADQKENDARSLGECLFFVLVNPCLVYRDRGFESRSGPIWPGAVRCTVGLLTWAAQLAGTAWLFPLIASFFRTAETAEPPFPVVFAVSLVGIYLGHSGLASVQIGLMRLLGWRVPERYVFPLLASSPSDLWRRWNTYVMRWARAYLFSPVARSLVGSRILGRTVAMGIAVLWTFAVTGALHALPEHMAIVVGEERQWSPRAVWMMFGAFGLVYVGWESMARLLAPRWAHWGRLVRFAVSTASWALFWGTTAIGVWIAFKLAGTV